MSVETVTERRRDVEPVSQSPDTFSGMRAVPSCLSALVAPSKDETVQATSKENAVKASVSLDSSPKTPVEQKTETATAPPITTKEFLTSYGFLGLKSTGAMAVYGLGMLNGWQYSGAFIAGAIACWAVEGAITPFLGHNNWNPVQLAYSGASKLADGIKYMVGKTLDSDIGRVLMRGDGFTLRLGVAGALACGAWLTANPIVVGLSGAIAYRAVRRLFS